MKEFFTSKVRGFLFMLAITILIPSYVQADTITVEAWIDGRSQLTIRGNTAQWHHFDFTAPGREGGNFPTIINEASWFPTWPDVPDGANVDCDCDSSVFTNVIPALGLVDQTVALNIIQARDSVTIIQQPAAANNYELIVEFDDNSFGGADWYIIVLGTPTNIPTMTEWGMIIFMVLAGIGSVYYLRRQRRIES